jgi:chemotaxis protein CheZ
MAEGRIDTDLGSRLEELRAKHGDTVKTTEIVEVVESVLATMKGDLSANDLAMYDELESLADYIRNTKGEIAALRPDEVTEEFLPTATDELDAVVAATADATNAIMDAVEEVENVMGGLDGEASQKLMDATTRIYEACGFQDITGQRITRVVKALKHIEEKVDALVAAFGSEIERNKAEHPEMEEEMEGPIDDADLLHGPQMEGEGQSQDDIDALLASFD